MLVTNRKITFSILVMVVLLICGLQGISYGQHPLVIENPSCEVNAQGRVPADVIMTGTIRALRDVENVRVTGAHVGPAPVRNLSANLGDFRAGQSKKFSAEGTLFIHEIDRNNLECIIHTEWEEIVSTPQPDADLVTGPKVLVVDSNAPPIYWISYILNSDTRQATNPKIQRVNLDGSNAEDLVTTGFEIPFGIALDVADGKMYWTDPIAKRIQRANLDGSNVEDLVTRGLGVPYNIALDVAGGKMYWVDRLTKKIQRANLNGSNIEDLVTRGLEAPGGIALDVAGGKMYWTDSDTAKIQRANLNGSNIEDLVTRGLENPFSIVLDIADGKMYWTDSVTDKIQRANLNGSNVEDLVTRGLEAPAGIALDIAGGKMYWTDTLTKKIQRANLDGTNVQDVVTGTRSQYIALGIPTSQQSAPQPDLVVEAAEAVPATVAPGETFRLYATLKNRGRGESTATTLRYYRSTNNVISTEDTQLSSARRNPLAPNATLRRYLDVTAPTTPGTYYYGVCVDSVTNERDTDNNCSIAVTLTVTQPTVVAEDVSAETPTTDATVSITPASIVSPAVGEQLEFSLHITDGETVAGYQATVQFDDTALRYVSGENGDFLPAGAFFVRPFVEDNLVKLRAASLTGETNGDGILATLTFEVTTVKASNLTLSNVLLPNSVGEAFVPTVENAEITEPTVVREDVNADGVVDVPDLVYVAQRYGQTGNNRADVNGDGVVNIDDLILVAAALDADAAAAPALHAEAVEGLTVAEVKVWLSQARQRDRTDPSVRRSIQFLAQLLASLVPKETALLSNYPNPFNPETWIPYQLAKPAKVTLHIYAANGRVVRTLSLGHQAAGVYQDRSRAAYWDGRNAFGEPVASGVYFYTLTAGEFTATRKMLIRK